MAYQKAARLPPGCGADIDKPLLFNPYQQAFQEARRKRVCLVCARKGIESISAQDLFGVFTCLKCGGVFSTNLQAPRAFNRFCVLAGRGGGKTLIGAHAVREELMIPNSKWWVMGPTHKILHDSTFPTLVRLLDPNWIQRWDPEHTEITLKNGSMVAFRSLDDPERARGPHGLNGGWFDEAAQAPERAYHVFAPTLIAAAGIVIATTTVMGYDWTYDQIEKQAQVYKKPGYWSTKYWTEENPYFKTEPARMAEIENAKLTMSPSFYAQEYKADRRNAEGLVYDFSLIEKQCLLNDAAVKEIIPEWPEVSPSRQILVGLDSGANHPFGAVKIVVCEKGLVVVGDYLERMKAVSQHVQPIGTQFGLGKYPNISWSSNKNEANLRLEFYQQGISVIPAENKHEVGIQRVQSWLYTKKLFFAYTVPRTIDQMRAYRYADNLKPSGEKKAKEEVFKLKDELPDAVRYAIMAWPELPEATSPTLTPAQQARWEGLSDKQRADIERVREYEAQAADRDLDANDANYPVGSFFGSGSSQEW